MAKVGRPKKRGRKPDNGVRMRQVSLCLTPGERRRLGARARVEGQTFSAWARQALLESASPPTG